MLTAEQYSELPETFGFREELLEGERVLVAFPKAAHALVIENLEEMLEREFPVHKIIREQGWHFETGGIDNVPGPDLMVLTADDYDRSIQSGGWFQGKPLFVIEVISPSERRSRRMQKVGLYLEAGAGAVVEVDYTKRVALIHKPDEDAPDVCRERISWPFEAQLSDIFARLP